MSTIYNPPINETFYSNCPYAVWLFYPTRSGQHLSPEGFVYPQQVIPDIELEIRYFGNHNFLVRLVDGYSKGGINQ